MRRTWIDAKTRLEAIANELTAYDFGQENTGRVTIVNKDDHAIHSWPDAFVLSWESWYLVFAEHHGNQFFYSEDVVLHFDWDVVPVEEWTPDPRSTAYWKEHR